MNRNLIYKIFFVLTLLLTSTSPIWSQIALSTQAEVDAFDPSITEISGDLTISGDDIVNIDALSNVTMISGNVSIDDNPALTSIDGLINLTKITGELTLDYNPVLTNINGLSSLTDIVGTLTIEKNYALLDIDDLINVTDVLGRLTILANDAITNIDGLNGLAKISGILDIGLFFDGNASLLNVDGLSNVTEVTGTINIKKNDELLNVNGLSNITEVIGTIAIGGNDELTNIDGLSNIIDAPGSISIYDNSSLTNVNGLINITEIQGYIGIGTHTADNESLTNLDGLGNVTNISGTLVIRGNHGLINIDGLNSITEVTGSLIIERNDGLTNINGLSNLTDIVGRVVLEDNESLANVDGLSSVTDIIGKLEIGNFKGNPALTNIDGLSNLSKISGTLYIEYNDDLTNVDGLSNLTEIEGTFYLENNDALINVDGLSTLTAITGSFTIGYNTSLSSIDGLSSLTDINNHLAIVNNDALTNINGLSNLTDITGSLNIGGNDVLDDIGALSGLTDIVGSLSINGNVALVNIDGLSNLTDLTGYLYLSDNTALSNIDALNNLTDIIGSLNFWESSALTNIDGLSNLTNLTGDLKIRGNASLQNINALNNLTDISGYLEIKENNLLPNIDGLSNLTSISGSLILDSNASLVNIDSLINVTEVAGSLSLFSNPALANIDGLFNIDYIDFLRIWQNDALSNCCGIYPVLSSGNYDLVNIFGNLNGCNSIQDIVDSDCKLGLRYELNSPCIGADNGSIHFKVVRYDTIPFYYTWEHEESGMTGMDTTYESVSTIDGLIEGTYNVTLTLPNGASTSAIGIALNPIVGSLFEIIELTTVNSTNGMPNGNVHIEYEGGQAPYTIDWSGAMSGNSTDVATDNFLVENVIAGDYTINITDANSNEVSIQMTVLDDTIAAVECEAPMDIVVLNLVSGAINADEYKKSKLFFHEFFESINLGENSTDSRASIIEWSGNNQQETKIPLTGSIAELSNYASQERCYSDNTNILEALEYGSDYLRQNARVDAEKVIIFTFDGCPPFAASAYAEELKEEGFIIADIGIDYVNNSSSYRSLLTQAASIPEVALFGQNFDEIDPDILYSRISYLFCEGSTTNAYFSRDGSIEINSITNQGDCPYPSSIDITFTVEAHMELTLPSGTPVTFYHNDPTLFGATSISTFIIPCSIPVGTSEVFTITLPLEKATHLYVVLNDDGLTNPAFELPVTDIIESQYSNNIASQQICVDGFATLQSFKSSSSLLPICEDIAQYTIDVCNISTVDAIDVSIEDDVAPGFVLLSSKFNDNGCSIEEGGVYDIPAGCCVSLTLDYDISSANAGHYRNQNVYLSGPVDQTYLDFNGENTTAEDIILNGEENCGSNIVLFTKEVDNETTCEDHSLSYTYTIDNQTSNSLIGLEFSDVLPEPLHWVYKPYSKAGLSITTSSISDQSATFIIDEIQAETTANFVIDVYVGATDVDVVSSSSAMISGLPAYINNGSQEVISNSPMTTLLANTEIDIADTIYVLASENAVSLEANLSGTPGIVWTTSGDGFFSDPNTSNPIYQMGLDDTLDSLLSLFVEVSTFCGQKGKAVLVKRICDLEFSDEELNICLSDSDGADAIITWDGGFGSYRLDENWSSQSITSPYTITNVVSGNYTITIMDTLGCTDQLTLSVSDSPQATTEITCISDEEYLIDITAGNYEITADSGYEVESIGDNTYQINNIEITTTLSITITDAITGCETIIVVDPPVCATATEDNGLLANDKEILVPNIIALNSGGNNIFYPTLREPNQLITTMQIYDRFGKLVFSNENFAPNTMSEGWDGRRNGAEIQSGVYMYLIQTKSKVYTGDVTVIR